MELASLDYDRISRDVLSRLRRDRIKIEDAKDLVQEVFARLLQSSARVENLPAFAFVVARNLRFDQLRRSRLHADARTTLEALYGETCDSRDGFRLWSAAESLQHLLAALDEMPSRRREIWHSVRLFDESHKSVAEQYGVTVKCIEKTLWFADRQLAALPGYDDWRCQGSDAHLSPDGSSRIEGERIEPS